MVAPVTYFDELIQEGVPKAIDLEEGFTFEDLYDEHIANNQKTWKQDRRLTVGASECFSCIRKTWFTKRGHEFGHEQDAEYAENWGAMERGNIIENHFIVPAMEEGLKRRGLKLIMAGDGQDTILDGIHSATLDGLIIPEKGGFLPDHFLEHYGLDPEMFADQDSLVLEMKSFDPRLAMLHEKEVHRGQTQMQMGLIRQTTKYKPEFAVLMYINASWLSDIRIFIIPYDEHEYLTGRTRNERVFNTDDPGQLPPEGKLDGDCKYCKFVDVCGKVSVGRVPPRKDTLKKAQIDAQDPELVDDMSDLVAKQVEIKARAKEIERDLEEANEAIRQRMIRSGESRVVGAGFKAFYSAQQGAKRLSARLIEEAGLDPNDFKEQGTGFEKLTVTIEKPKE